MSNKSKLIGAVAGATLALGAQTVLAGASGNDGSIFSRVANAI